MTKYETRPKYEGLVCCGILHVTPFSVNQFLENVVEYDNMRRDRITKVYCAAVKRHMIQFAPIGTLPITGQGLSVAGVYRAHAEVSDDIQTNGIREVLTLLVLEYL